MGKPNVTAAHMILILDGHEVGTVAYLSGGQPLGSYTEESGGLNLTAIRRVSATEVEPFVVEVGALRPVLGWIDRTLSRQHASRSFELKQGKYGQGPPQKAFRCALTEVAFPLLDRRSAGHAYLKLKVQPERIENQRTTVTRRHSPPMLPLSSHTFRLHIDGVLDGQEVQRVEAFTIKVGLKKFYAGDGGRPELVPLKPEFPSFAIHLPPAQAQRLKSWHESEAAAEGRRGTTSRKGRLELFSRGGARAMTLELAELDIVSLVGLNTASAKVDIACGKVTLGG